MSGIHEIPSNVKPIGGNTTGRPTQAQVAVRVVQAVAAFKRPLTTKTKNQNNSEPASVSSSFKPSQPSTTTIIPDAVTATPSPKGTQTSDTTSKPVATPLTPLETDTGGYENNTAETTGGKGKQPETTASASPAVPPKPTATPTSPSSSAPTQTPAQQEGQKKTLGFLTQLKELSTKLGDKFTPSAVKQNQTTATSNQTGSTSSASTTTATPTPAFKGGGNEDIQGILDAAQKAKDDAQKAEHDKRLTDMKSVNTALGITLDAKIEATTVLDDKTKLESARQTVKIMQSVLDNPQAVEKFTPEQLEELEKNLNSLNAELNAPAPDLSKVKTASDKLLTNTLGYLQASISKEEQAKIDQNLATKTMLEDKVKTGDVDKRDDGYYDKTGKKIADNDGTLAEGVTIDDKGIVRDGEPILGKYGQPLATKDQMDKYRKTQEQFAQNQQAMMNAAKQQDEAQYTAMSSAVNDSMARDQKHMGMLNSMLGMISQMRQQMVDQQKSRDDSAAAQEKARQQRLGQGQ